jgi:hypothetical protein
LENILDYILCQPSRHEKALAPMIELSYNSLQESQCDGNSDILQIVQLSSSQLKRFLQLVVGGQNFHCTGFLATVVQKYDHA